MDVGRDNGLVVDRDDEDEIADAFTGTVERVVFDPLPTGHAAEQALHEHAMQHSVGQGATG